MSVYDTAILASVQDSGAITPLHYALHTLEVMRNCRKALQDKAQPLAVVAPIVESVAPPQPRKLSRFELTIKTKLIGMRDKAQRSQAKAAQDRHSADDTLADTAQGAWLAYADIIPLVDGIVAALEIDFDQYVDSCMTAITTMQGLRCTIKEMAQGYRVARDSVQTPLAIMFGGNQ